MQPYYSTEQWASWLDQLAEDSLVVMEDFLPASILTLVDDFFAVQLAEGALAPAKIGTAFEEQRQAEIRSDFICWIDQRQHPQLNPFFQLIEELRGSVAHELFLSLEGFEFHLAQYPPGGFYKPHLDQFKARNNRMLSLVIYLNQHWIPDHGGQLRIHEPVIKDIEPVFNRAVLFRSDLVLHEVLPAHKTRKSLTGWLLKRPSGVGLFGV